MKKTYSLIIVSFVLVLLSCKKDEKTVPTPVAETPIQSAINLKTPADTIYSTPNGSANFGLKFYPTANGTINKLGCRMPEAGTYTVTLWDFASAASLAQADITITIPSQFVYTAVSAISVTKDTRYVVSVNNTSGGAAKKYFQLFKKPTTAFNIYPFTNGKVTFEAPLYKGGAAPAMPDYNNASDFPFIRGVPDIDISF